MKTIMKGLVGLVLVLVLLLGALAWRGQSILARHWEIAIAPRTATLPPPDLAEGKRLAKNLKLVVGNLVQDGLGGDNNTVTLFDVHGAHPLPPADKLEVARGIVAHIAALLEK